jgi:Spy/CpxP family protein refolding chaperone
LIRTGILAALVLTAGAIGARQHQQHEAGGPLSTLTADQIAGLQAGDGMGLAKAAELNHYPGPKHALELATELELSPAQAEQVTAIRDRMLADAVRLGAAIIEKETTLHMMFANRHITDASMRATTAEIGALQAELRATHLAAHLAMAGVLTPDQVRRYDELRGYAKE